MAGEISGSNQWRSSSIQCAICWRVRSIAWLAQNFTSEFYEIGFQSATAIPPLPIHYNRSDRGLYGRLHFWQGKLFSNVPIPCPSFFRDTAGLWLFRKALQWWHWTAGLYGLNTVARLQSLSRSWTLGIAKLQPWAKRVCFKITISFIFVQLIPIQDFSHKIYLFFNIYFTELNNEKFDSSNFLKFSVSNTKIGSLWEKESDLMGKIRT